MNFFLSLARCLWWKPKKIYRNTTKIHKMLQTFSCEYGEMDLSDIR